jgi:hypothetical protein
MHSALNCEMRDEKKIPASSKRTRRPSSPPDVMDVAAQPPSIMYNVFAGSISINKNRIASKYSTISCRNFRRQPNFAIEHTSSLIAILRIHMQVLLMRISPRGLSTMSVMGSTYSTNIFTLSSSLPSAPGPGTI